MESGNEAEWDSAGEEKASGGGGGLFFLRLVCMQHHASRVEFVRESLLFFHPIFIPSHA